MTSAIEDPPGFAAKADRTIGRLQALVAEAQDLLALLRDDVAEAGTRLGRLELAQIVEANQQLVLAAMRSQTDADAAARALEEVSKTLHRDALTGLPDRFMFLDRFDHAISDARRRGVVLALLFLDLNQFKQINDTLGHGVGDEVLMEVATRLAATVREVDTISRLGGDEFVILLTDVTHWSDAVRVADKMIAALSAPSRSNDHLPHPTASIGISFYPADGDTATVLLERADAAMYRAKRGGFGSVACHVEAAASGEMHGPSSTAA